MTYTWRAQRRGFIRNTLKAGICAMSSRACRRASTWCSRRVRTTGRHTYSSRARIAVDISWFNDPRLDSLKIGVPVVGDDYANTPPMEALARRGHIKHLVGFTVYGDYSKPNPPAEIVHAVAKGDVDIAIVETARVTSRRASRCR